MFRVQFFCPRQSPYWQDVKGFFGINVYPEWDGAVSVCNGLLWQTTVETLREDRGKYLKAFWKMFPFKYGHLPLDSIVPGTESLRLADLLSAKTGTLYNAADERC